MGRNVIYSAVNLITGETVKGRSKDLMRAIGCKHYDPYNYARTNSVYKRVWKITAVNKRLEKPVEYDWFE